MKLFFQICLFDGKGGGVLEYVFELGILLWNNVIFGVLGNVGLEFC